MPPARGRLRWPRCSRTSCPGRSRAPGYPSSGTLPLSGARRLAPAHRVLPAGKIPGSVSVAEVKASRRRPKGAVRAFGAACVLSHWQRILFSPEQSAVALCSPDVIGSMNCLSSAVLPFPQSAEWDLSPAQSPLASSLLGWCSGLSGTRKHGHILITPKRTWLIESSSVSPAA